jgi:hypothetical protein
VSRSRAERPACLQRLLRLRLRRRRRALVRSCPSPSVSAATAAVPCACHDAPMMTVVVAGRLPALRLLPLPAARTYWWQAARTYVSWNRCRVSRRRPWIRDPCDATTTCTSRRVQLQDDPCTGLRVNCAVLACIESPVLEIEDTRTRAMMPQSIERP